MKQSNFSQLIDGITISIMHTCRKQTSCRRKCATTHAIGRLRISKYSRSSSASKCAKMVATMRCFFHKGIGRSLSVPAKKPIKPIYAQAFVALLEDIGAER